MNLYSFLGHSNFEKVGPLLDALTRALNAYADRPVIQYIVTNHPGAGHYGHGSTSPEIVQNLAHRDQTKLTTATDERSAHG